MAAIKRADAEDILIKGQQREGTKDKKGKGRRGYTDQGPAERKMACKDIYRDVLAFTRMLQGCYRHVAGVSAFLHGCYRVVTNMLQRYYSFTRMLQGCYKHVKMILQLLRGCYRHVTEKLQLLHGCYRGVTDML